VGVSPARFFKKSDLSIALPVIKGKEFMDCLDPPGAAPDYIPSTMCCCILEVWDFFFPFLGRFFLDVVIPPSVFFIILMDIRLWAASL